MEFETNIATPDDARLLNQAKKVTITPLHTDIVPEDLPESAITARHASGAPIANVSNDIEQDSIAITQAESVAEHPDAIHPKDRTRIYILTAVGLVLFALVAVAVILQ